MKKHILFIVLFCITTISIISQTTWSLKLKSKVELRTYRLTNKVEMAESGLSGATITLYNGNIVVVQMQSDGNGEFEINVPSNGEYILAVSYAGCNTKKFAINTMGVPESVGNDKYTP